MPFGDEDDEVNFRVPKAIAFFGFMFFMLVLLSVIALMKPAYDKLKWNTFQEIGSDVHLQTCYQNFEVAKGTWLLLFWYSGVEISTVFFFEDQETRIYIESALGIIYVLMLVVGYLAVRN